MPSFVPHSDFETKEMLRDLQMESLEELFQLVDPKLRLKEQLRLPEGVSEFDVLDKFLNIGQRNLTGGKALTTFAGGGAYDHEIPSVLKALGGRSEFVTAYTPYQPEVAQGVLQALFEFQTLISRISGLEISNASIYDGASSLVEAINLSCAATSRSSILISEGVNERYIQTVETFSKGTGLALQRLRLNDKLETDFVNYEGDSEIAALVVGYPNYFGAVENLISARDLADKLGALLVVVYDPISMAVLKNPGELGADVAVAEGQPFGIPLSFGGPYLGLFSTKKEFVRLVPGRLVGETKDTDGKTAYVTTLRTREQDIRRERATSNVCTNQTLMAVWATIHLSWLGKAGFIETAKRCHDNTRYLVEKMSAIDGVTLCNQSYVREVSFQLPIAVDLVIDKMAEQGYLAGVKGTVRHSSGITTECLILTATEKRTQDEMDGFVETLEKVVRSGK